MDKLYYGHMGRIVPCVINGISCVLEEGPVDIDDLITIWLEEIAKEKAFEELIEEHYRKGLMGDD